MCFYQKCINLLSKHRRTVTHSLENQRPTRKASTGKLKTTEGFSVDLYYDFHHLPGLCTHAQKASSRFPIAPRFRVCPHVPLRNAPPKIHARDAKVARWPPRGRWHTTFRRGNSAAERDFGTQLIRCYQCGQSASSEALSALRGCQTLSISLPLPYGTGLKQGRRGNTARKIPTGEALGDDRLRHCVGHSLTKSGVAYT